MIARAGANVGRRVDAGQGADLRAAARAATDRDPDEAVPDALGRRVAAAAAAASRYEDLLRRKLFKVLIIELQGKIYFVYLFDS